MEQAAVVTKHPSFAKLNTIFSGANPREYFDPDEMEELVAAVRAAGRILQSILVNPIEGGYRIIAGERRWRAAKIVFGDDYDMPILVADMTEEEAENAAVIENTSRANMSLPEEAVAASKKLGRCGGDRDKAAKELGWTRSKLDKRLALMNCSENVRRALTERKIELGYAELLATATKERQDDVLAKLLAKPSLPPLQQFKAQLESISKSLAAAIFDKQECAGCQYNSTNQSELFGEAISEGHCTNGACYDTKTEQELTIRSESLKDEYPTIKIIRPGENFTVIKIVAEGKLGVGEDQAKACHSCQNFGAAVSGIPGSMGNVYKEQCFDPVCNGQKVAARIKAEKQDQIAENQSSEADTKAKPNAKASAKAAPKTNKPTVTVQDSQRVKDYCIKVWRGIMRKELMSNPDKNFIVLLALGISGHARDINGAKMSQAFKKLAGESAGNAADVGSVANVLAGLTPEVNQRLHIALAASIETDVDVSNLRRILTFLDAKVETYWKLSEEYLDLLTKSEIDVLLDEIGLKSFVGAGYSKLLNGKKAEIIKAVLSVEGFSFEGKVPKAMQYSQEV